jgi:helicase MOV-10
MQLHLLLHLEELQQETDVHAYDIEGATLEAGGKGLLRPAAKGSLLSLHVPGLAEARPSVMRGDALYVSVVGNSRKEYQGFVYRVELEQVSKDGILLQHSLLCCWRCLHRST